MRIENGIPRPEQPRDLRADVDALTRLVKRLEARRAFVSAGNIVQGGTISKEAGAQLTETVQEQIVVGRENVEDEALNGRALVGSSVSALGEYMAGDPANPYNPYNPYRKVNTRAVLDSRPNPDSPVGSEALLPGVYLESEDPALAAPHQPARLVVDGGDGAGLYSEQVTKGGPAGSVTVAPGVARLQATGDPHPGNKLPGVYSEVRVGPSTFRMQSAGQPDVAGRNTAGVMHDGDGILRLVGPNGVLVNGAAIGAAQVQHAEFTTAFAITSSTTNRRPSSVFVLDRDASLNHEYATAGSPGSLNLPAGVYAVTFRADCGAPMGQQGRLAVLNGNETRTYQSLPVVNEWDGTLPLPNLYLPQAGAVVFTVKQTSGVTLTCNVRVSIEKIK